MVLEFPLDQLAPVSFAVNLHAQLINIYPLVDPAHKTVDNLHQQLGVFAEVESLDRVECHVEVVELQVLLIFLLQPFILDQLKIELEQASTLVQLHTVLNRL